jgi:hypothetical protein
MSRIEAASKVFPVTTVQNRYNLNYRAREASLDIAPNMGSASGPRLARAALVQRLASRRDRPQAQGWPPVANRLSRAVPMITPLSHLTVTDAGQYGNAYLWFESISLRQKLSI